MKNKGEPQLNCRLQTDSIESFVQMYKSKLDPIEMNIIA